MTECKITGENSTKILKVFGRNFKVSTREMLMAGCAESRGIRVEREQGKRS
jgi:hypothetical protein